MRNGKTLVTGATGNVGSALLRSLMEGGHQAVAAVRDVSRTGTLPACETRPFDFAAPETHRPALAGVDRVFLMRPPVITNLHELLDGFFAAAREAGVEQVVYLSVMGADRIPGNPHRSVERYVQRAGIPYTFLRPAFFMQNLTMHHAHLIATRGEICVPAGRGRTSFIDTRDIGEAGARVLTEPGHTNRAYTLTGAEALTYDAVAAVATDVLGREIRYTNPSPFTFRREMLAQGYESGFINFMIMLYFLTRIGLAAKVTDELEALLRRRPRTIRDYLRDNAEQLTPTTP